MYSLFSIHFGLNVVSSIINVGHIFEWFVRVRGVVACLNKLALLTKIRNLNQKFQLFSSYSYSRKHSVHTSDGND